MIGLEPYYEVNDEVEVQVGLNNPIRISNKKVTLKYKTLKKKTLKAAPVKATKAVGKVTYKITGATGKAKIKKAQQEDRQSHSQEGTRQGDLLLLCESKGRRHRRLS